MVPLNFGVDVPQSIAVIDSGPFCGIKFIEAIGINIFIC